MGKKIRVAASLLACNFNNIDKDIKTMLKSNVDWLHLDVMDGHFVPNISFGLPVVKSLESYPIFKDVHLMISDPKKYVMDYINAGADMITFHLEALKYKKDIKELINIIHEYNRCVGISIKPNTPVEKVIEYLPLIDMVLVMSVEPGFGGQKFMESSIDKVKQLNDYIESNELECFIEVDGGINDITSIPLKEAGVDVLVSGSYLFKGIMKDNVKALKSK